ncbi:hypothetical protein Tco_0219170, partial [Tanacetum coccineum]
SPVYAPDPIELEDHVPVYVLEPVEDLKEDPVDYAADADDDDDDEEEESFEDDDEEEEEHLAPTDSTTVTSPAGDHVSSAEETKPFETNESAATPPPPPAYYTTLRMSVRSQAPIPFPSKAEVARLLALSTSPPSLLTLLSLPLPQIPSPPLPVPSPPTTFPTYTEAPLGYRPGSTVAHGVDYSFVNTVDVSIRALERRTMAAIEMVNLRRDHDALHAEVDTLRRYLSSLCTTHKQERVEARQDLARSEAHNRALEARIAVLETQAHRHEWQCQDADDRATGHIMRI